MKKNTYTTPTCKVVILRHRSTLLAGSGGGEEKPTQNVQDYDDLLG